MHVALGFSVLLNLVFAFFLALHFTGRAARFKGRLSAKELVDDMRAKDEARKNEEFLHRYGRPRGVPDRLPRTTKRIVADPARECPVVKVEMQAGSYGYWQVGDKSDEPFLAFHYPRGGTHGDLTVPADAYVVDYDSKAPLKIYPGESFRKQCKPSQDGMRVMGTNQSRPTHPIMPTPQPTPLDGKELSEEQLDDLVKEYQLDGFRMEETDTKAVLQNLFVGLQSPPCAGEPVPQIGFPEEPTAY